MGVRSLNTYVNRNITLPTRTWKIDRTIYNKLKNFKNVDKFNEEKKKGDIIIIDGNSYFYFLSNQLNWFIFDYMKLFDLLKKQICLLLSIASLKKIIFVFDGMDTDMKMDTKKIRANDRINSMIDFLNKVLVSPLSPNQMLKPSGKICPTPLLLMSIIQFILDTKKIFDKKLEVKFSNIEADTYIAKLAIDNNGYVISNDSDFFIYPVSGYINFNSLKFPNDRDISDDNNLNLEIKFELYNYNLLLDHLHLSVEALPFFASLCSNDYLNLDDYPRFFQQIKHYRVNHRITNNIRNYFYKTVVNFILDCCETVGRTNQDAIKNQILQRKNDEYSTELNKKFENCLNDSINEYNLTHINLLMESDRINQEILDSYRSGKIYAKLINVLENNHYKLTQYFEICNRYNCYNITSNLRKDIYKYLIARNKSNGEPKFFKNKNEFEITEYARNKNQLELIQIPIEIDVDFPISVEDRYTKYLNSFESNIDAIKGLPYYLIPIASSLRYYLIQKINLNLFIPNEKNNKYSKITKTSNYGNSSNSKTVLLHYYEFEALLSSAIAALTFTYLNKNTQKIARMDLDNEKPFLITNNIEETNIKCNNIYEMALIKKTRSLELKNYFNIESLQKNATQFENAIQIFAEFINVLIMNSNALQVLKLTDDFPELYSFYSMYHYLWEEAYYSMIEFFKIDRDDNISFIFNHLFTVNDSKEDSDNNNFINYLEKVYSKLLNSIINN